MGRPDKKVRRENRIRVAEACESCKKRHQRCDSNLPCQRCVRHHINCTFSSMQQRDASTSPGSPSAPSSLDDIDKSKVPKPKREHLSSTSPVDEFPDRVILRNSGSNVFEHTTGHLDGDETANGTQTDKMCKIHIDSRMLQDSRGLLCYVGSESVWSFLQSIRNAIDQGDESMNEHKAFTEDPNRFSMAEPLLAQTSPDVRIPTPPPNPANVESLVSVFFDNTGGFIEVLDRERFTECLLSPHECSNIETCLLYLVFAIGTVLSGSTSEDNRGSLISMAEAYFQTAKYYCDPSRQLEEPDIDAVSVYCLMTFYEMMLSRWRIAYHYLGLAVPVANSKGLHQTAIGLETGKDLVLKECRWKSLCILDTIVSTVLGVPTLEEMSSTLESEDPLRPGTDSDICQNALTAVSNTCQTIRETIEDVYKGRKIAVRRATGLLGRISRRGHERLGPSLDHQRLLRDDLPRATLVSLATVDIMESFGVMLLTRPFLFNCILSSRGSWEADALLKSLAEACVASATRTIYALHKFSEASSTTQNPLLLHFCFTAAITLLSNEYFGVFENPSYTSMMEAVTHVFDSSGLSDVHTKSLIHIVEVFEHLVGSTRRPGQERLSSQVSAEQAHNVANINRHMTNLGRSTSVIKRNAPQDSKASMAPQVSTALQAAEMEPSASTSTLSHQPPWPPQPPESQAHHGHVPTGQYYQKIMPSDPNTPAANHTSPAYAQYPALEGLGPQVVASASHPGVYTNEAPHPPNQYWQR